MNTPTTSSSKSAAFPLIPLRDLVVFPGTMATLFVGREASRKALIHKGKQQRIVLSLQKEAQHSLPSTLQHIHTVGVIAKVVQTLSLPDGVLKILVEGVKRVAITKFTKNEKGFFEAHVRTRNYARFTEQTALALRSVLMDEIKRFDNATKKLPDQLLDSLEDIEDPNLLLDTIVTHCGFDLNSIQSILATNDLEERYEIFLRLLQDALARISLEEKIKDRIKQHVNKSQREYYLQEQMKAIQKELGGSGAPDDEVQKLFQQAQKADLPEHVFSRVQNELNKMRTMNQMTAEASVIRSYVEWILALPWKHQTSKAIDLATCAKVLDEQHYGLTKIKERILEYLAVQTRIDTCKGQTLCFVGPPGVGKTSLARSIAVALNRPFIRCALGGVHDEGEIRGHRRTYIGSMPGKILQNIRRAKTLNPVFLLDEVDKMGRDWRGDPSSALLEVLDSEQNTAFNDHYIELDYDLSHVFFVATANSLDIPPALMDRMDIVHLEGYTELEKIAIAKKHLIPKILKENGVLAKECTIQPSALPKIVHQYTQESGVRQLTRSLTKVVRKSLHNITQKKATSYTVKATNIEDFLGVPKFLSDDKASKTLAPGACCGLSWSAAGGNVISIESTMYTGKGKIILTGHMGRVMSESAQIALSLAQCYAKQYRMNKYMFSELNFHVHVPDGAIPKDGPSAGITMTTALVSLITETPVHADIAMTGEVTLQGKVLAIGGLKDKLLAAMRVGIKRVIIPEKNKKDLADLPKEIKSSLKIIMVSHMDEVLRHALAFPVVGMPDAPGLQPPYATS